MQICNHTFMRISWAVDKQMERAISPALQPDGCEDDDEKTDCSGIGNGASSYIEIHRHGHNFKISGKLFACIHCSAN